MTLRIATPDAVAATPRTGMARLSQVLVFKIDSRIFALRENLPQAASQSDSARVESAVD
jgi:hypothetical protein